MPSDVVIGDNQLELTRFYGYPREAVFAAWTEPDQLDRWWGCDDTESCRSEIDLRTGGSFRHVMTLRGAGEMVVAGTYEEVVVPERLVTSSIMGEGTPYAFESRTTVEFTEQDGGTLVRLVQVGLPPMPEGGQIVSAGTQASLNKLEQHLAG